MAKMNIRIGRDNDGAFRIDGDSTTKGIMRAVAQARDKDTVASAKTLGHTVMQHQQKKMVKKARKTSLGRIAVQFLKYSLCWENTLE